MKKSILYVGLDIHAASITAAVAEGGRNGEIRLQGRKEDSASHNSRSEPLLLSGG